MSAKNYHYIYNMYQANFFIMNGLEVLEIGRGSKGDFYCRFLKTDKSKEVFDRWVKMSKPE